MDQYSADINLQARQAAKIEKNYIDPAKVFSKETLYKAARAIVAENLRTGKINQEEFEKAIDQLEAIEKGGKGEGSRGGKVIGHTKSGKPIYAGYHESFEKFSSEDHRDAHDAHRGAEKKANEAKQNEPGNPQHEKDIVSHKSQAATHDRLAKIKSKQTEGHEDHGDGYTTKRSEVTDEGSTGTVHKDGKQIGKYEFDRSSNAFWTEHGSHDTKKEMVEAFKKKHGLKKAYETLGIEYIEKAGSKGEGSRGGNVIGHTSGGKPIYEHGKHSHYGNFHENDHHEASMAHSKLAESARVKKNSHETLRSMAEDEKNRDGVKEHAAKVKEYNEKELHHSAQSIYHAEEARPKTVRDRYSEVGKRAGEIRNK